MKSNRRYLSVVALALVFFLSISPSIAAAPRNDDPGLRDRIVRVIKKIQKIFTIVSTDDDYPSPPKP